jgi:hypothetical protein
MSIKNLPLDYEEWLVVREASLEQNLLKSDFTADLFNQYRKHLGWFRYQMLKQAQMLVLPRKVSQMLFLGGFPFLVPVLHGYKLAKFLKLEGGVRSLILPQQYKQQIANLDRY